MGYRGRGEGYRCQWGVDVVGDGQVGYFGGQAGRCRERSEDDSGLGRRKDRDIDPIVRRCGGDGGELELFLRVFGLPLCATDNAADPFGAVCGIALEDDLVPEHEGIVPLYSDAGVGADLSLEDPRCGTGFLGKRRCTFL